MILRAPTSWLQALINGSGGAAPPPGYPPYTLFPGCNTTLPWPAGGTPMPGPQPAAGPLTNQQNADPTHKLRLVRALQGGASLLAFYPGDTPLVAQLINAAAQSITPPASDPGPWWLQVPQRWVQVLAGAQMSSMPTSGDLHLSLDCACDFHGGWISAFQAIGFTGPFTPITNGRVPVMAG